MISPRTLGSRRISPSAPRTAEAAEGRRLSPRTLTMGEDAENDALAEGVRFGEEAGDDVAIEY
jgi:hypothetical protein